jgi:hypothetical protein
MAVMPEMRTPPKPPVAPSNEPFIQTSKEAVKRSRELLEETKGIVDQQRHWPAVRNPGTKPPKTG